jgi:FkbM family methyltransferase
MAAKASAGAGHSFYFFGPSKTTNLTSAGMRYFPAATFVDCANIGYFSVLAGGLVGAVAAWLPWRRTRSRARCSTQPENERLTGATHAPVVPASALELFVPRAGGDVYSCIRKGGLVQGDEVESFRVNGRTLDDVLVSAKLDRMDVVKIDVEGAELDVLHSGQRMLQQFRPVVICEYGTNTWPTFGASPADLLRFLSPLDYEAGVFDLAHKVVRPADATTWSFPCQSNTHPRT